MSAEYDAKSGAVQKKRRGPMYINLNADIDAEFARYEGTEATPTEERWVTEPVPVAWLEELLNRPRD